MRYNNNNNYNSNQNLQIIILEQNRVTKVQQILKVFKLIKNKKNQVFLKRFVVLVKALCLYYTT